MRERICSAETSCRVWEARFEEKLVKLGKEDEGERSNLSEDEISKASSRVQGHYQSLRKMLIKAPMAHMPCIWTGC